MHISEIQEPRTEGRHAARQPRRQGQPRDRLLQVRISSEDLAEIAAGAVREGATRSAFVVAASLVRARGGTQPDPILRETYAEFKDAAYRLNKLGVNLNQVARKLNTIGEPDGSIEGYAEAVFRSVQNLDALAIKIWRRAH